METALIEHPLRLAARLGGRARRLSGHSGGDQPRPLLELGAAGALHGLAHGDWTPVDALDGEQLRARGLVTGHTLGEGGQLGAADRLGLRRRSGQRERRGEAPSHEEVAGSSGGRKPPVEFGGGGADGRSGEVSKRDVSEPTP